MLIIISDLHLGNGTCSKLISPFGLAINILEEQKIVHCQVLNCKSFNKDDKRQDCSFVNQSGSFPD